MSEKIKESKSRRKYDKEFKAKAVLLARELGSKKAAMELGIPEDSLKNWIYAAKTGHIDTGRGTQTPETVLTQAAEIQKLKAENKAMAKEIARIKKENEFLEEASAFFAASRQRLVKTND